MATESAFPAYKRTADLDSLWPAGFEENARASQYKPPVVKEIYDYDSPNDPKMSLLTPSGVRFGRSVFPQYEPPYKNETESVRDPYYKFSRDPDMSLDTAPYPSGIARTGRAGYRGNEANDEEGTSLASLRYGEKDAFLKQAIRLKDPLAKFTAEGAPKRREFEEIELQGDAIVHTGWYAPERTEDNLISIRTKHMTSGKQIVGRAEPDDEVEGFREGRSNTTKWLTRTQEKLEEANSAATEAARRAEAANHLAIEADQLADAAKQRRELADEATERARSLPGTIKGRVDKLRSELGEAREEAADKERAAESARRELEYTEELAERKQRFAHSMRRDAAERRGEVEELKRQLAKLEVAKKDADSAEERAKEVQKESERFMMELQSHEKKAQEKATALVNHKHRMGQLAEELAAAIANEELSQPQVRLAQEEAKIYIELAEKEEAQAKALVIQWGKVKEEVHALESLEHEARKEVLEAQPEGSDMDVGNFHIRQPKQAQALIENGGADTNAKTGSGKPLMTQLTSSIGASRRKA